MELRKVGDKVAKYKTKPVVIEAVQFQDDEETIVALQELGLDPIRISYNDPSHPKIVIETLKGEMKGEEGDYIIKGAKGEFYHCKSEIFEMIYESIE